MREGFGGVGCCLLEREALASWGETEGPGIVGGFGLTFLFASAGSGGAERLFEELAGEGAPLVWEELRALLL